MRSWHGSCQSVQIQRRGHPAFRRGHDGFCSTKRAQAQDAVNSAQTGDSAISSMNSILRYLWPRLTRRQERSVQCKGVRRPAGAASEGNISADLHITPNGQFLYCSNRGLDNIAIFRIDVDSGLVSFEGVVPCGGKTPRNFAIDATGHYLLCANQDSDNIVVFEIDTSTGQLTKKTDTHACAGLC